MLAIDTTYEREARPVHDAEVATATAILIAVAA
jgi:hypothetical protein